jgi:hypothetical protein
MAHIIEEYEKSLGVKKSYPVVNRHFFPTDCSNYILISNQQKVQSKKYPHFLMAVDLLKSFCKDREIKIYQLGCGDEGELIQGVDRLYTHLTFRQEAYLISKALALVSVDNVYTQYASSQKIPTVNLFGNVYPSVTRGCWNNKKIDLEPDWKVKPSLSHHDPHLSISSIYPEVIAQSVIEMIEPKVKINFITKRIGHSFYDQSVLDVIPNSYAPLPILKNKTLMLRLDYGFNENAFFQYCKSHECALILRNNVIQIAHLEPLARNIRKMIIRIDTLDETIDLRYFDALKKLNIDHQIIIEDESILNDARLEYFDQNVTFYTPTKTRPKEIPENACFFSFKKVVDGSNVYESKAHWKNRQLSVDKQTKILDTPEYWEDIEYYYIYEQSKNS